MNDENDIDNKNDQMAAALERTGRFRVLRKLQPRASRTEPLGATRRALFIDLETTGLDARADEVIEIGLLPFVFTDAGDIVDVLPAFDRLRQPTKPIPPKISDLTGITNEMVAGRTIDPDEIAAIVAPAELIIAHNARFDRPFAERLHPIFAKKPWGCSMTQALWTEHGFEGLRLDYLLMSVGLFHDNHRAPGDCHAGVELLARPLGGTGRTALAHVLEAGERTTVRVWAVGAPYDKKELLRSRGYRWNAGDAGRPRAWFRDVDEGAVEEEIALLRAEILDPCQQPLTTRITALDRFSDRV